MKTTELQSVSSTDPTKTTCPHCGSPECFEDTQTIPNGEAVTSYMCMECGYTTTTLNVDGSMLINEYESQTAELIKDLRWIDDKNLVWYPTVLNFPSFGIIFPDGINKMDWRWTAAPAVDVPIEDQKNYPIPGQKDKFYQRRIDMTASKKFLSSDFYEACLFLGFIKPRS